MPKQRQKSEARADTRPAFARPPGARAPDPVPPRPSRQRPKEDEKSQEDYSDTSIDPPPRKNASKRPAREKARASPATSPLKDAHRRDPDQHHKRKISEPPAAYDRHERTRDRAKYNSGTSTDSTNQLLSTSALSKLNEQNDATTLEAQRKARKRKEKQYKDLNGADLGRKVRHKKNRNVSGAILEEGRAERRRRSSKHIDGHRGGYIDDKHDASRHRSDSKRKRKLWIVGGVALVLLIVIIAVAVVASRKKGNGGDSSSGSGSGSSTSASQPKNTCTNTNMPQSARGTILDVSTWRDTTDFNCTYTEETVGGLSIMGLNSKWDDSAQANGNVPPLNKPWSYGSMPVRGTNIGGWLNLEPFIAPSLFSYSSSDGIVDEWTLSQKLGNNAQNVLENHYATFITKADFQAIRNAGLDHVRIPFGYWAITTYAGDPYVKQVSWRYLLRAIEWAREYGLRVNLDLHGVPGSQNAWAHSGRQGSIGWLQGADGDINGQRSLDIHNQLSQFFAQDRYKNVVTFYGLVNEPKMIAMTSPDRVLEWNKKAISLVRGNGIKQQIVFGDGFLPLTAWNSTFKDVDPKLMLDTHQYQIFNTDQLRLKHADKINLACSGWTGIMKASNNPTTGWGPTINGEWSQADTDCTQYLNNVGAGSRWAGTLNTGDARTSVTTQTCYSPPCSCAQANADPSQYSAPYKKFLKMYAEAQMHSFEQAQGWFYWTWKTESATQWSWKLGMAAGILPAKAYQPEFKCDSPVPSFSDLPENY